MSPACRETQEMCSCVGRGNSITSMMPGAAVTLPLKMLGCSKAPQ